MKRKPYCVGGMSARREQKCNDSGNVSGTIGASAFPTCGRRRGFQRGRGTVSRPSATCARQQPWQQTWGCRENDGRSRRRWGGCMRQRAILRKRALPLVKQRGDRKSVV